MLDVSGQSGEVLCQRCLLHVIADGADFFESIPSAIAFHAMTQKADRSKVSLFHASVDRGEVPLPVGEKAGYDRLKVGIDANEDSGLAGLRLRWRHCARVFS